MKKSLTILSYLVILLCYTFLALCLYWLLAPYNVIDYKDSVLPLTQTTVKQGGTLEVRHRFCKFIDVVVNQSITLEDHVVLPIASPDPNPKRKSSTPIGCYDRIAFIKLPMLIVPGTRGRIHYYLYYQVNPIRTVHYHLYTQEFTVIK